ncbi:MAG TPA: alpha/beta hydrolase, partial [Gemmatimonadaceae bacterium]|nr:alpha/beta hydrolase [Gemmatimonadaceae bacterium]
IRELLERSVADGANMPEPLIARYLAPYVGDDGLNHLLALARSVDKEDMIDVELGQIDCPSLIVWGDQDPFVSPRLGDRLADTIPGSRLVRLPGTGRLVPEESAETLANMILEFVGAAGMARNE